MTAMSHFRKFFRQPFGRDDPRQEHRMPRLERGGAAHVHVGPSRRSPIWILFKFANHSIIEHMNYSKKLSVLSYWMALLSVSLLAFQSSCVAKSPVHAPVPQTTSSGPLVTRTGKVTLSVTKSGPNSWVMNAVLLHSGRKTYSLIMTPNTVRDLPPGKLIPWDARATYSATGYLGPHVTQPNDSIILNVIRLKRFP